MEQRFSRGEQSTSSDSLSGMVNGGRRLLQMGFPPAVIFTASSSPPNLAPATDSPPSPPSGLQPLDPNVVIIMVVLLFALICAAFLNSIVRCVLRRRMAARNARGVFIGRPVHDSEQGLDAKTLASLPVLTFKAGETSKASQPTALECTICLSEFTEDERLRLLPKCSHVFHLDCIDMWLLSHISCPVCRAAIGDEDGEAPAENGGESPDSGDVMLLVRDSAGNASVRRTLGVRITEGGLPGVLGAAAENLDVRAELTRDKSWNSLSDAARMSTSKRFISGSREGSMSRRFITAGSREGSMSHHSFRVAIDSILNAPDNFFSGRKSAAPSVPRLSADRAASSTAPEPHSPLELSTISSPNEKTSLAANDQLQVDRSPSPPSPEIK